MLQQHEDNELQLGLVERQIEAMLFVAPQPVGTQEIAAHLGISGKRAEDAVSTLCKMYETGRGLTLVFAAGGWQMTTAPDLSEVVESFASVVSMQRVRLSRAALETLSVIAYNQPVTRSEIEDIRSVRCDRVVDTLLKHGLVRVAGRKKSMGSPLLFRTTDRFLEIFGLSAISALPSLDELRESGDDLKDVFAGVEEEVCAEERETDE